MDPNFPLDCVRPHSGIAGAEPWIRVKDPVRGTVLVYCLLYSSVYLDSSYT